MKTLKHMALIFVASSLLAVLLGGIARMAYDRGFIQVDVGEASAFGSDREEEWNRAAYRKIRIYAIVAGALTFTVFTCAACARREHQAT